MLVVKLNCRPLPPAIRSTSAMSGGGVPLASRTMATVAVLLDSDPATGLVIRRSSTK